MSQIQLEDIPKADVAQLQDWLTNHRFKIEMTNWNSMTEEERSNTLVPLNGDQLSRDDFQSQVEGWSRQTRNMFVSIVDLCNLVSENNINTFRDLGDFFEHWRPEQIYLILIQYLDKLNEYWHRNSFALLPESEMKLITDDVRKLERLAKLLHNEAKYQMEVRLISEEVRARLTKTKTFKTLIEEDDHVSPWNVDLFGDMLHFEEDQRKAKEINLPEREKYVSPVQASALKSEYDTLKNRTSRW